MNELTVVRRQSPKRASLAASEEVRSGSETPLIRLRGLRREFRAGDEALVVLNDVDLDIRRGEMVAIMGQSGSGKSTLMNVLGCLDRGWTGTYEFAGQDVSGLDADALATLRRNHYGFIFQRYQLLTDLDAVENVEVPAIYAGAEPRGRRGRARELLTRLGLGDRLGHKPSALSGGQQQRVSVARALMNGGEVILADEPTGALDSRSGKELMALLHELNEEGHTIILVTHDPQVASEAQRIVEIADGRIIDDRRTGREAGTATVPAVPLRRANWLRDSLGRAREAFGMALRAMASHKLRTFLTMLGIIIGIASVVSVVALGQGSQQTVLERISAIGSNTINVLPGASFAERRDVRTLVPQDAQALMAEPYADSVTPQVSANRAVRQGNVSANASVGGVGEQYFRVSNREFVQGIGFDAEAVAALSQDAVIDEAARDALFAEGADPLGQRLIVGNVPVRVIGVVKTVSGFGPGGNSINVWLPYTTAMTRLLGQNYLSQITVRIADDADITEAQAAIEALMLSRHGAVDFMLQNTDTIRETIQSTSETLTLLISAIAIISLVVGGIGVMNIMLVSVTERTKEIGIRMAVGARRADIMRQFLIEAVLVCLAGGTAGVLLSLGAGALVGQFAPSIRLEYSMVTIIAAFVSSSLIGIAFGFMPARSAARLDPVQALARE